MEGKSVLITGCASGIGRHMAGVMLRAGARVLITDVDAAGLELTLSELGGESAQVKARALDVRSASQWEATVAEAISHFGKLDILMNIAGISHSAFIQEADPAMIERHLDINLKGVMLGTHYAAREMVRQKGGHIVNIASLAGLCPVPGMSLYAASKFGVRGFSLSIAQELKAHGVQVSVICPDAVATPMLEHEALEPEAALSFSGNRILTVDDIERAIMIGALGKKKLEVIVPGSMSALARFVTALPALSMPLLPYFRAKGQKTQARYRASLNKEGTHEGR